MIPPLFHLGGCAHPHAISAGGESRLGAAGPDRGILNGFQGPGDDTC